MTVNLRPTQKAGLLLLLYGGNARAISRSQGKSNNWLSNVLTGHSKWTPRIEAEVLVALNGATDHVREVKRAALLAYEYRHNGGGRHASR